MMTTLDGKIVLLTGANRGIGLALARRFLGAGARCMLTVRSDAAAAALARELGDGAAPLAIERCDIGVESDVTALLGRVRERVDRIDVLINNAAIFLEDDRGASALTMPLRVLRETLEVNLYGTIAMCQAFAPLVPRGGRIINVSSTMGQLSDGGLPPYATAYSMSKTALNAYTSALANSLAERGVMADVLHPGWVQTDMGGPGAQITPEAATDTVMYLAERALGPTGKFWFERRVIPW
jgi:NAD(P)-dependent dehydrogenase (short-subunit alcohol dehydrogenase family)